MISKRFEDIIIGIAAFLAIVDLVTILVFITQTIIELEKNKLP